MFKTPQKRGGNYTHSHGSPTRIPLNGLFSDGVWKCNCAPRLPAPRFQVRKEGANRGKWFYTCQDKDTGCGFFLWDEKAQSREKVAVISNSRSEPDPLHSPVDASRDRRTLGGHDSASNVWMLGKEQLNEEDYVGWPLLQDDVVKVDKAVRGAGTGSVLPETPKKAIKHTMDATRSKRMANKKQQDEEDFGGWPLTPDDEVKIVKIIDKAVSATLPETPGKVAKYRVDATPGSKRKRDDGEMLPPMLPTPLSTGRPDEDVFTTPATSRRLTGGMWDGNEFATPTPLRFRTASPEKPSSYDITTEVMELLKDTYINADTETRLKDLLNRHALKISGIARGRDITRVALKTKDVRIAELQQRIAQIEVEREVDRAVIRRMKGEIAEGVTGKKGKR